MSEHKRSIGPRWKAAALLLGVLLTASPAAAGIRDARQAGDGKVRIVASYRDAEGNRVRLAGVEVVLLEVTPAAEPAPGAEATLTARHMGPVFHPGAYERYACTNANGVAVFPNLSTATVYWAVIGVGHPGVCTNAEFINPSTGRKMLSVDSNGVYGGGEYAPFSVVPDATTTIRMFARSPKDQQSVCAGFYVTLPGTPGDDVITGTDGPDVIAAGEGDDRVYAGAGWDVVCAGRGNDVVYGGIEPDLLFGDEGRDLIKAQGGVDWAFGGTGTDTCRDAELTAGCEKILTP